MPSQKNLEQLEQLKTKVSDAKSIVIADYAGLNSSEQTELRAKVSQAGGELSVSKNRLFKIAISEALSSDLESLEQALNGPNAFLFAYEDAVSALKALFEFAQNHEALQIKLGILDDKVLSYAETEDLSKLPTKPELIAQLISRINGPTFGLVNVLSGPTRGLVQVLSQIKDQKQAN